MTIERFIDPYTAAALENDSEGNLYRRSEEGIVIYRNYDGCYDFVTLHNDSIDEKEHYDKEYSKSNRIPLTLKLVEDAWHDESVPWYETLLTSLGELNGKKILLLGNGQSYKELYFFHLGADVVFTDISFEAIKHMKRDLSSSELNQSGRNTIEFHAVDAMHMPFPDQTFDIIYGAAFVHHLDDVDAFLSEVHRCLKSNGICRFIDQAFSPIWEGLKKTLLIPFRSYSYWKYQRSPEDLKGPLAGGVKKEELINLMRKYNFSELIFLREWFFLALVLRHYGKSVQWRTEAMEKAKPLFLFMKRLDTWLKKKKLMKNNNLILVWGFNK